MTREELEKAFDLIGFSTTDSNLTQIFLDFASLIKDEEREACAQVCDNQMEWGIISPQMKVSAGNCADLIRARGQ